MSNQKSMVSPHPSEHQTKESQPLITRSGSQLLVEALQQEDVDFIFGYPGGAVLPLYDTFYDGKSNIFLLVMNKVLHMLLKDMRVSLVKQESLL